MMERSEKEGSMEIPQTGADYNDKARRNAGLE